MDKLLLVLSIISLIVSILTLIFTRFLVFPILQDRGANIYLDTVEWQKGHQVELYNVARLEYANSATCDPASRFLAPQEWRLTEPIDIDELRLDLVERPILGDEHYKVLARNWPRDGAGRRLRRYHDVVTANNKPKNWFNGESYRLVGVERLASGSGLLRLDCSSMKYWDGLDSSAALAYEASREYLKSQGATITGPYRRHLRNPFDLSRRNCAIGISVLTICKSDAKMEFYLHERTDGVAVLSGMIGCLPAGEFQPSAANAQCIKDDFSIWRCMMREYAEEFLDLTKFSRQRGGMIDYWDEESPFPAMQAAREAGKIRPYVLDIGIDPLTWKAGIRLVYIFDADVFDAIFRKMTYKNSEGNLVVPRLARGKDGHIDGWPFTQKKVFDLLDDDSITEAMKQCLKLTWEHRELLGLTISQSA